MGDIGRYGHVFALEGDWWDDLTSRTSVRGMLELLEGLETIRFVHKDVRTRRELEYYLGRWSQGEDNVEDFYALYLAVHGTDVESERGLWLSNADDGVVSMSELARLLGGDLQDVVVHLGACSVLNEDEERLRRFCRDTGIKALVGYTTDVNWVESAAMDMLFFGTIAKYSRWASAQRALENHAGLHSLKEQLGFRIVVA